MIRRKFFAACAAAAAGVCGLKAAKSEPPPFELLAITGSEQIEHRGTVYRVFATKPCTVNGKPYRKIFAKSADGRFRGLIVPING